MTAPLLARLTALTLVIAASPAMCGPVHFVDGQKIDSGLGELPHYSAWADPSGRHPTGYRVLGESLDSGLGELPHYSKWIDPTGKDPLGRDRLALSKAAR